MKSICLIIVIIFIQSCQMQPIEKLDPAKIKMELDSIMVLDQMYRNELNGLFQDYGYESSEFQNVFKKQEKIDSTNLIYVENLIATYGKYPGNSLVGHSTGKVAFFVLQHASDTIQSKYLDLILEASKNKELNKRYVAMFHDRYLVYKGESQIYGTQIRVKETTDSISGKTENISYCYPIRDTVKIDSLRLWNGLLDLEGYLNSFGLSRWDKEPSEDIN